MLALNVQLRRHRGRAACGVLRAGAAACGRRDGVLDDERLRNRNATSLCRLRVRIHHVAGALRTILECVRLRTQC